MSFINASGHWAPFEGTDDVPFSRPDSEIGWHELPRQDSIYVDEQMWRESVSQAQAPGNIWEMIKFAGAIYSRQIESINLPIAEWDAPGRGLAQLPLMQSPNVVSGNMYNKIRTDRYGPFNDPRQSQSALDNFLASAVPSGVNALETSTMPQGTDYTLGYGRPGG